MPFILLNCSSYKKVSLINLEEYQISKTEISDLEFVLKIQKLHYLHTDRHYQVNNYMVNESTPFDSYKVNFQDNIMIPKGTSGVCIYPEMQYLIIDFGEGVLVPFILSEEGNHAKRRIEINQQNYSLTENHRAACLYFNSKELPWLKED